MTWTRSPMAGTASGSHQEPRTSTSGPSVPDLASARSEAHRAIRAFNLHLHSCPSCHLLDLCPIGDELDREASRATAASIRLQTHERRAS